MVEKDKTFHTKNVVAYNSIKICMTIEFLQIKSGMNLLSFHLIPLKSSEIHLNHAPFPEYGNNSLILNGESELETKPNKSLLNLI